MYVVHVSPFIRGTHVDTLSYFSAERYDPGTIVSVPVRGKTYRALVISLSEVSDAKSSIRSAPYSLRKLPVQNETTRLPQSVRDTAAALTREYPTELGALLFQLLPPDVRSGAVAYPDTPDHTQREEVTPQILTAPLTERYVSYRSHIRSTFAHRGSVLFIVPSSADVVYAARALAHGIEDRVITFHAGQSARERAAAYATFGDTSIARLIIATPSHAFLDRVDLLSIIVEHAASTHYKSRQRPFLDYRRALQRFAQEKGCSILLGDVVPRAEEEQFRRTERYLTVGDETKRIALPAALSVINTKPKAEPEQQFQLLSERLIKAITTRLEAREHVFLHAARRGLAPLVVCIDCGYIFRCPDSDTPYSLLRTRGKDGSEERWFISGTSGKRVRAADVCPQCGSWRLRERGIGIQQVADAVSEAFPSAPLVVFDHTTATTYKKARTLIERFYHERAAILVGTNMALPYLKDGIDLAAIVSYDATRSIPTWRADEEVFRLLMELRERTRHEVIVQTRLDADAPLQFAARGAIERFFEDELKLREALAYPPFARFILITWQGSPGAVATLEAEIMKPLAHLTPQRYNSPHSSPKKLTRHALITIPGERLDESTVAALRTLPPQVRVEVDPERIV